MAFTNPTFVLTTAGLAAKAAADATNGVSPFSITSFAAGSAFGYTPNAGDTALHGTQLYKTAPFAFNIISGNILDIVCVMDINVGPFSYGEIGIYGKTNAYNSGNEVLYALACYDAQKTKTQSNGAIVGDRVKIHALLQVAQGVSTFNVTYSALMSLPEVNDWNSLPLAGTAIGLMSNVNAALVKEADPFGNYSVVVRTGSNWTVLGYDVVATVAASSDPAFSGYSATASTVTSAAFSRLTTGATSNGSSSLTTTPNRYLVQFGNGYIRSVASIAGGVATINGTLPAVTGSMKILQCASYSENLEGINLLVNLPAPYRLKSPVVRVDEKDSQSINSVLAYANASGIEWSFLTHQTLIAWGPANAGSSTGSVLAAGLGSNLIPTSPAARRYIMQFVSGANQGQCRFISAYTYAGGTATITPSSNWATTPSGGDVFKIYEETDRQTSHTTVASWVTLDRVQDNAASKNSFIVGDPMPKLSDTSSATGSYPVAYAKSSTEWGIIGYSLYGTGTITSSTATSFTASIFSNLVFGSVPNKYLAKFADGRIRPITSINTSTNTATIPTSYVSSFTGTVEIYQASTFDVEVRKVPTLDKLVAPSNANLVSSSFVLTGTTDDAGKNPIVAYPVSSTEWAYLSHNHIVASGTASGGSNVNSIVSNVISSLIESSPPIGKYLIQFVGNTGTPGNNPGCARVITGFSAGTFSVTPGFANAPNTGDRFVIYQSNVSKVSGGGGALSRNSIHSAKTDAVGNSIYLGYSGGLSVDLLADLNNPFILSWAKGFDSTTGSPIEHLLPPVTANITGAWSSLPASAQVYLTYDRDPLSGTITRKYHYNPVSFRFDLVPQNSIPNMTSATAPYGSATSTSNITNRDAYKAMSSVTGQGEGWASAVSPATLTYTFPGNIGGVAKRYSILPNLAGSNYHSYEAVWTGSQQVFVIGTNTATVAAGTLVTLTLVGAGGGGGGGGGYSNNVGGNWHGGGGGGGGGALEFVTVAVSPGYAIVIDIGAGGAAGLGGAAGINGTNGSVGGATVVSIYTNALRTTLVATITAPGGLAGIAGVGGITGYTVSGLGGLGATALTTVTAGAVSTISGYSGSSGGRGIQWTNSSSGTSTDNYATPGLGWNATSPLGSNVSAGTAGGGRGGLTLGPVSSLPTNVGVGGEGGQTPAFGSSGSGSNGVVGSPGFFRLEFGTTTLNTAPRDWVFQGNNGAGWVTLDTQSGFTTWPSGARTFSLSNNASYYAYQLVVSAPVSGSGSIEIDAFEVMLQNQKIFHLGQKTAYTYIDDATWTVTETNPVGVAITGASSTLQVIPEPVVTRSLIANSVSDLLQAAEIGFFASNSIPSGWLKANGAAVSRSVYYRLFAAIGTTYGAGDGVTTFNLPDLRGEFLRGWDDSRGADPGRVLGSSQPGTLFISAGTGGGNVAFIQNANNFLDPVYSVAKPYAIPNSSLFNSGVGNFPVVRPRNVALLACIKF